MRILLLVISLLWIIAGVNMVLYTDRARAFVKRVFAPMNPKLLAAAPLVVGLVFLGSAFEAAGPFPLLLILGLLLMAKAAFLALASPDRISRLQEQFFERASDTTLRFWGLIVFMLGTAVISYVL
jgi:hypothetical protein